MSVKKICSLVFKILIFFSGLVGILIQCGFFSGNYNFSVLNYYTLMSNILCVIYYLFAIINIKKHDTLMPQCKGALVMCIAVTGIVYHFLLSGSFDMKGTISLSNILLHYVVPIMTILDWFIFDKKGAYKKTSPLLWIIAPYVYFIYAIIRAQFGNGIGYNSRYPYPFIDFDLLGTKQVVINVLLLTFFFLILGYIIYFIDHMLMKRRQKK